MPFVTAEDGVRIHYELDGTEGATPLVLQHGFTSSTRRWREFGYVDALRDRFRLLLVDARGHGESGKPTRVDDYDWRARVFDIVAAMRDAGIEQAHLWGYSMGGQIAQSALIYAPQRFRSLVIGGASPYGAKDSAITVPFEEFWETVKPKFGADLEAWRAAFIHSRKFGGAVAALRGAKAPLLLYAGTEDTGPHRGLQEFVTAHGGRHFTLPGKTHASAFEDTDSRATAIARVIELIDGIEAASK